MITRRSFLKHTLAGLGVAGGFATNLASFNAFAADTSEYKALVCVFLKGGMDGHDLLIPYDLTSWGKFEALREPILSAFDGAPDGLSPRRRENLIALSSTNSNGLVNDGREFSLSQEMLEVAELYHSNKMAFVGNVGPLLEPITRQDIDNGGGSVPPRLFSHNDQQSIWQAGQPEGASSGWGGRFGDIMQAAGANSNAAFTAITTRGQSIFVEGNNVNAFQLSTSGGKAISQVSGSSSAFREAYDNNLRGIGKDRSNLIRNDIMDMTNTAIDNNATIRTAFGTSTGSEAFPSTSLGQQLSIVARMIANRDNLGMKRQIFIVGDTGYDTHSNQASELGLKHIEISQAMNAFYNETVAMGLENNVTTFTASDFGRSLVPNVSGTDHGWGNHHMVMGGAVNGGNIFGNVPEAEIGHDYEVGRGRLIPQTSVEQYAYPLARWFGLSLSETQESLPNLDSFDATALAGLLS
ncbi:DUF1501 domain-containing protein [Psychromonas sp.]|nr:DUF1501 domain-containing protein [Psychromonas sp.]